MDNKVSDYKLAESIIRKLCKKHGVQFVDVPVDFEGIVDSALSVEGCRNIAHTIFKIVGEYISRSLEITGTQFMTDESNKDEFLIVLASNLRSFMYGDNDLDKDDESHVLRLYQFPLIWTLMKDIICPIHNKELKNIKIIASGSAQIDIAKYYKQGEIPSKDVSGEPFIFINRINNRVVQGAFIFMESLRAMGLSPVEVIKDIYETEIYDKYHGFLGVALDSDDDVNDFECTTMAILGINFYNLVSKKVARFNSKMTKDAQSSAPGLPNQFGYIGLLEKMMEPIRQRNDWSVYQNLEPYIKDFWDKAEAVRKKRVREGHDDGVPFDTLLRIKSKQTTGYESDSMTTIQELLSSKRVW